MTTEPTQGANIGCEEALRRLAEHLDRELDERRGVELERHLETCRSCFSRAQFERELKARLASLKDGEVSPAFEGRIRDLVRGFAPR